MRAPDPAAIDETVQQGLVDAFRKRDEEAATDLACSVFEVDPLLVRAAVQT
jgi:hypothetical protein